MSLTQDPVHRLAEFALEVDPGPRATLAAIQLPTDLTLDDEGPRLLARVPGVRLRMQKLSLDGESLDLDNYASGRGRIAHAAATLRPHDSVDVIGLACTSLSFTLGRDKVQAELRQAHPGAKATDMATAVLAATEFLGIRRPALLTPYVDALHKRNRRLLEDAGLTVVADSNLSLLTDTEITAISTRSLRELALATDHRDADALLIGCSAFRACGAGFLDELEEILGKPVISSQQAFLWHLLRLADIPDRIGGYGTLFREVAAKSKPLPVREAPKFDPENDVYPTRVATPTLVARRDPVVVRDPNVTGPLTDAQVDEYERHGVMILRSVFMPDEVATLLESVDALREHYESLSYEELDQTTDMKVITERGGSLVENDANDPTLKSIWQIHLPPAHAPHMRSSAELSRRTICDARLVNAARQLLGEDVYIHQSRINYQPGFSTKNRGGSGFLWHQDFEQWHAEDGMPRMRAVSAAILLERAVPANGALMVMPGSHRSMLQAYGSRAEDGRYAKGALSRGPVLPDSVLRGLADEHGIRHCRGEPGDVVLFDCNTVHGSHTNISPWGRCMFFAVYNAVSNTPASRPFGASQRRPEHIGSHDPRFAGIPLPALEGELSRA